MEAWTKERDGKKLHQSQSRCKARRLALTSPHRVDGDLPQHTAKASFACLPGAEMLMCMHMSLYKLLHNHVFQK